MIVADLSSRELRRRLSDDGLYLHSGPFICRIQSALAKVADGLALAYADYPLADADYADFHLRLAAPRLRRWISPQVQFHADVRQPFLPLPQRQAYAMFEWGLNWCVSQHANQYLILHAAVLEKNGRALVLPGHSGAGKSTLCAGLVYGGGWRLLSDELTLIRPADGLIQALPRPVSLKNASIDVIKKLAPGAIFTPTVLDTSKGSVAHAKPPSDSVARQQECARLAWVAFPRYRAGAALETQTVSVPQLLMRLAEQAFNYSLHGQHGFNTLLSWAQSTQAFEFEYSDLPQAIAHFEQLASQPHTLLRHEAAPV